jgi:Protein of unknown function (DUF4054)
MPFLNPSFRAAFPEFGSVSQYPEPELLFWSGLADKLLGPRWGDLKEQGSFLFVAHNLSLAFNAKVANRAGRNPGAIEGTITSGSVDKASYSRDASSAMDPKNGHWNLSVYGLRYVALVRLIGAGPVHVGAPMGDNERALAAWPGPAVPWF